MLAELNPLQLGQHPRGARRRGRAPRTPRHPAPTIPPGRHTHNEEASMTVHLGRPHTAPLTRSRLMAACRRGDIPAEVLPTEDRERLLRQLWRAGWNDVEIATHTKLTTYTTARIRGRLGLAAHPTSTRGAA